jgi:peptidoglycan/LPS O-acetylase OafA/YrhL
MRDEGKEMRDRGKKSPIPNPTSLILHPSMPKRLASLDSLRAVAILLVLGVHMPNVDLPEGDVLLGPITRYWRLGGWIGVDLFFVLSGFLIGGLLFREFMKYGSISFGRFFIRRGLKIYPPFYVLFVVCLIVKSYLGPMPTGREILGELLFLQNYLGNFCGPTWSLAVEEHFYLFLPLVLFVLMRRNPKSANPFAQIPLLFLILAVGELGLRVLNACYWDHFTNYRCQYGTHLRMDSLMFGVLGAYYYHFWHDEFVKFVLPRRWLLAGAGILLLLPAFCFPVDTTPFIYTAGFTLIYLGSGLVLATMVAGNTQPGPALRVMASIGAYSYSIYLWHLPFRWWICPSLVRVCGFESFVPIEGLYICGSIAFGMVMGKVLEYPVLHVRDRLFPSRIDAVPGETSSAAAAKRELLGSAT